MATVTGSPIGVLAPLGPRLSEPEDPRATAAFGLDLARIQTYRRERPARLHRAAPLLACLVAAALAVAGLAVVLLAGQQTPVDQVRSSAVAKPIDVTTVAPTTDLRLGDPYLGATWQSLAACETGTSWQADSISGRSGGLGISPEAWRSVGGSGLPHQASSAEQVRRAISLWEQRGWSPWSSCAAALGWH